MPKCIAALAAALLVGCAATVAAALPAQRARFGFAGIEFYKLDWGTHNLRIADINSDGLNDIVVVNNGKARVECLIQRANPSAAPEPADLDPNQVPDDKRFKSRPFLSEKRILCLELGDLNGDDRVDMAYYGDPMELVVVYQNGKGRWGDRRTFDITDGAKIPYGLAIGDVNGDGRNDLLLLGTDCTYFITQDKKGALRTPVKEAGVPPSVSAMVLRDFNGDQRPDLLYLSFSETRPFCFRFQGKDGRLGPEIRCKTTPLRAVGIGDPAGEGREEIAAVKLRSGRLVLYDTAIEESHGRLLEGSTERYTLRASKSGRSPALALGAFSDPKRFDLVVTAPQANEVEMFFRSSAGHWTGRTIFPSLQAATDLAAIDSDGDGRDELLVLSPEEFMLGHAHVDAQGRLTFPRALPVEGKPTAMTVADLDGDGKPEILYAAEKERKRTLHVLAKDDKGGFTERLSVPIAKARSNPDGLRVIDINQDGKKDICVFLPYEGMRVFKAAENGKFLDVSQGPGYGKGLVQAAQLKATGQADVDGDGKPELLLAKKNFARAMRLSAADRLEIVDQFNGRLPGSTIVGVAGADLDGDNAAEIILVDSSTHCLTALKRNRMGVYEICENFKIGPVSPERIVARDLTGDDRVEILLLARDGWSILHPARPRIAFKEIASYETPVRNGHLIDVVLGDLDRDGRDELLVTQSKHNTLELIKWDEKKKALCRVLNWPVFEAKRFAGRRFKGKSSRIEPREFLIGDVTGDKKPDIVLLIHDRILVYPQE